MPDGSIRAAKVNELTKLQAIERLAGRPFADIGMTLVAQDEPPSVETLAEFQQDDRAWVWVDAADEPIAYLIAEVVDGNAHLEQVSVDPDHAGQGIGRRLIDHLLEWAREHSLPAVTLTTYVNVPWNGPYYLRYGFRYLDDGELTPGLRDIRAAEVENGLDQWPRAGMRLDL